MSRRSPARLTGVAITLVGATLLALTGLAAASKNFNANSGHAWPNADTNCFQGSFAFMTNSCAGFKTFVLPMWVEIGASTVNINVSTIAGGSGSPLLQSTCCQMIQTFSDRSAIAGAPVCTTGSGGAQSLKLGNIGGGGFIRDSSLVAHVECNVPQNAFVFSAFTTGQ
jgi:hypothetical protein